MEAKGWHSRGYLPHFDGESAVQFITWRTFGSYPKEVLERISDSLQTSLETGLTQDEYLWDELIDHSSIGRFLDRKETATVVIETLLKGEQMGHYTLFAWVVMPNHVHILLLPKAPHTVPEIVKALKSVTSRKIAKLLKTETPIWAPDYFDRFIRTPEHFWRTIEYINQNPFIAGLVRQSEDWAFSSASQESLKS